MKKTKKVTLLLIALLSLGIGCGGRRHSKRRKSRATVKPECQVAVKPSYVKVNDKKKPNKIDKSELEALDKKVAKGEMTTKERNAAIYKLKWGYPKVTLEDLKKLEKELAVFRRTAISRMTPEEQQKFVVDWESSSKMMVDKNITPAKRDEAFARQVALQQIVIKKLTPDEQKKFVKLLESLMQGWLPGTGMNFAGRDTILYGNNISKASGYKISTGNKSLDRLLKLREIDLGCIKYNTSHIKTVAVLPMVNITNSVDGPEFVRHLFYEELGKFHYKIKPEKEVKKILNWQMGITLGKQLALTTPQKVGKTLGVDALFYGYLINFDEKLTGVYNAREVRMGWKLVDTKTGKIIWGRGIGAKSIVSGGSFGKTLTTLENGMNVIRADEVSGLPGSKDPMKEMPGLGRWVVISKREEDTIVNGLIRSVVGKIWSYFTHSYLEKESKYAARYILH